MDTIKELCLYREEKSNCWFFDDSSKEIEREPFIEGMSEIISEALKKLFPINACDKKVLIRFSEKELDLGTPLTFCLALQVELLILYSPSHNLLLLWLHLLWRP
jgi:hypothetical protein